MPGSTLAIDVQGLLPRFLDKFIPALVDYLDIKFKFEYEKCEKIAVAKPAMARKRRKAFIVFRLFRSICSNFRYTISF